VGDISKGTFFQFTAGVSLWTIYGVPRGDLILLIANLVTLVTLVVGLAISYRFRTTRIKGLIQGTPPSTDTDKVGVDNVAVNSQDSQVLTSEPSGIDGDIAVITGTAAYPKLQSKSTEIWQRR